MLVGIESDTICRGGLIVKVADCDEALNVAWICAVADETTPVVVMVKVALVCPASTVTFAPTVAEALSLLSATLSPPTAAGPDSVTVPVAGDPPTTVLKFNCTETTVGACTVSVLDCDPLLNVA